MGKKSKEQLFLERQELEFEEDKVNPDDKFCIKLEMKNINTQEAEEMYQKVKLAINKTLANTRYREQFVIMKRIEESWSKDSYSDIIEEELLRVWSKGVTEKLDKDLIYKLRRKGIGIRNTDAPKIKEAE